MEESIRRAGVNKFGIKSDDSLTRLGAIVGIAIIGGFDRTVTKIQGQT